MIKLKDILVEKCWKGYEKKGMKKMFGKMYPNCVKKKKKREVKEDRGPCWKGYTQKGMKKKGYKMVPKKRPISYVDKKVNELNHLILTAYNRIDELEAKNYQLKADIDRILKAIEYYKNNINLNNKGDNNVN